MGGLLDRGWEQAGRPCERRLVDAAQRSPWLAIDPKPLIGEREFSCAPVIRSFEFGHSKAHVTTRTRVDGRPDHGVEFRVCVRVEALRHRSVASRRLSEPTASRRYSAVFCGQGRSGWDRVALRLLRWQALRRESPSVGHRQPAAWSCRGYRCLQQESGCRRVEGDEGGILDDAQ